MLQACYWFVGSKNFAQPMFAAVDILTKDGEKIGETHILSAASRVHGLENVERHCMAQGVSVFEIWYDDDTTQLTEHD
jgi:hypothetical protein